MAQCRDIAKVRHGTIGEEMFRIEKIKEKGLHSLIFKR
ncbi:MAG: hypothetical protein JETT_1940 [Candidatus Jettenia ecosi]|uniref:Uncharacterized protein n=1 Tax=Candidatus Jettenia ecosi TaxID=2494326 RepID=A0A533QAQ1_9BACT|nr:MAG: hypothetical protein JETT_1940 [Candidatus Jettenia ecosi]